MEQPKNENEAACGPSGLSGVLGVAEMIPNEKHRMASWVAAVIDEYADTDVLVNDLARAIISVFDAYQEASLKGKAIELPNPQSLMRELEIL